jgi:riboflavin kinase/FMN adenylyltransferase
MSTIRSVRARAPVTIEHSLKSVGPRRPTVITIGTFDGVHRGHLHLLRTTIERADRIGAQSAVLTFEPIPMMVLRPDRFLGRICSAEEKVRLLAASGVDIVDILSFDREFSLQTPEEFLARVMAKFDLKEIVVGEDFSLGKDRAGNVEKLTELGQTFGFSVTPLTRIGADDESISSTEIRESILAGDVARAATLLGRFFHVEGVVVHGAHFGRKIGYPTANIDPPADHVPLADGIYASRCWLPDEDAPRDSMTYVGTRPTVNSGPRAIETNILDFHGDLYGRKLRVDLVERLRPDENFPSLEELIAQLARDEAHTRAVLARLA